MSGEPHVNVSITYAYLPGYLQDIYAILKQVSQLDTGRVLAQLNLEKCFREEKAPKHPKNERPVPNTGIDRDGPSWSAVHISLDPEFGSGTAERPGTNYVHTTADTNRH